MKTDCAKMTSEAAKRPYSNPVWKGARAALEWKLETKKSLFFFLLGALLNYCYVVVSKSLALQSYILGCIVVSCKNKCEGLFTHHVSFLSNPRLNLFITFS